MHADITASACLCVSPWYLGASWHLASPLPPGASSRSALHALLHNATVIKHTPTNNLAWHPPFPLSLGPALLQLALLIVAAAAAVLGLPGHHERAAGPLDTPLRSAPCHRHIAAAAIIHGQQLVAALGGGWC